MRKTLIAALALLLLWPVSSALAATQTWAFEWNKSHSDATAQGFYNFGTSRVDRDFYTAELNGLLWNIAAQGTNRYAFTANSGQAIGTAGEPASHVELWTNSLVGTVKAVRIVMRTNRSNIQARVAVAVGGVSYTPQNQNVVSNTLDTVKFAATQPQEGRVQFTIDTVGANASTLYIKRIEIDYETVESSVAAPVFSPAGGAYDGVQTVTLSASGASAIWYTTDRSNPRIAADKGGTRQQYAGPIAVDSTMTLMAAAADAQGNLSDVSTAAYTIRLDPELRFNVDTLSLSAGDDGYADLLNPHRVSPVTYTSSSPLVCSVDDKGTLYSSYTEIEQWVTITATFAGNGQYKPATARMTVRVIPKEPLAVPVVTPLGGTFNEPVQVSVTTTDDRAVTIWYSTTASSVDEFKDDNTKSVITEGKSVTFTLDHSCRLYVMTRGYNVNSPVVTADFNITLPLQASFTTDRAATAYYEQNFDSQAAMADWTAGTGWALASKNFSTIDAADKTSASIGYGDGTGSSALTSPEIAVQPGSRVQFYAYFSGVYLVWGSWQFSVTDTQSGQSTQLLDAFNWAQDNAYTGPNWNLFDFDLSAYAGKKVKFTFNYNFGGEDLALDGFKVVRQDTSSNVVINLFEGDSIKFTSTSAGTPDALAWQFPGGDPATSTAAEQVVTYSQAGTFDVTLTATRGSETSTATRKGMVHVAQRAPTALIGLPDEGYESPFVGVFVPTNVPVTFRDLSTGNPTEWNWVFQHTDVTSSTEQNPTVTFVDKGTFSVGLTARNGAGQSNDVLLYAIQAGGAQYAWNIAPDENQNIEKVTLGWYGNYAGSNWLGMKRFAERYKAPLAEAGIDSVAVYFASATVNDPAAPITLAACKVNADGTPGNVMGTASIQAGDIRVQPDTVLATTFRFASTVALTPGEPFFLVIGPFPNTQLEQSPYTADDVAIYCVRRSVGSKCTAWQELEDQDSQGNGLGTYQWFENTDDPVSMAIAPVINYDYASTGLSTLSSDTRQPARLTGIYNLAGQRVTRMQPGTLYILQYSDGTARKVIK